jgi:hypothetical protein
MNKYKPFPEDSTIGDLYHPAMKLEAVEEAKDYFERLVEYGMAHGQSREEAEKNLGYFSGYYDATTAQRVFKLFECAHPFFGTTRHGAAEELEAGKRMAKSRK